MRSTTDRQFGAGTRVVESFSESWCANDPPCVNQVPPIPQDCAELEGWISDRNCDLRNALEFGNTGTITQFGIQLSQGIAQLTRVSEDVVMEGQSRSSLMESMIEESDAKRRFGARWRSSSCVPLDVREPSVRIPSVWVGPLQSMPVQCEGSPAVTKDSRYGFRGVRIGEVSNPGPPRTRARARMEQEAEVALTGLEALHALMIRQTMSPHANLEG